MELTIVTTSSFKTATAGCCPFCRERLLSKLEFQDNEFRANTETELQKILHATAVQFGIDAETLVGPSRLSEVVRARRWFCLRAREKNYKLSEIARALHRHHSSIISLIGN